MGIPVKLARAVAIALFAVLAGAVPALAEQHPAQSSFGSFADPNGIAIDEATGDVYVADIGADAVYKFDAGGNPVSFASLGANQLTGAATPQKAFSFAPKEGTPAAIAVDNACIQHNPALTGAACAQFDPSAGDLYVLDAADKVVDKFSASGEYLGQLTGPWSSLGFDALGVDGKGRLRVQLHEHGPNQPELEIFDDSLANVYLVGFEHGEHGAPGMAVAPNGDMYMFSSPACGCTEKWGGNFEVLGKVDTGPADVAAAVDPVTGHVYVDRQSSVVEFDTGTMNGARVNEEIVPRETLATGESVSTFGSAQLGSNSSGRAGIAVDGQTGEIYVSSPADGKVYVFGTSVPSVGVAAASDVTTTTATLNGAIDPHGETVTACRFEYEVVKFFSADAEVLFLTAPVVTYRHAVPCKQAPAALGSGTAPVPVSAEIDELQPGKLYDVRVVAENASGTGFSGERFATSGLGFGIKAFSVTFLNADGSPTTQAGSHPFTMDTDIELNTKVISRERDADARYVTLPDGHVRDFVVNLPPGLVGDPNATAKKCTVLELEANKCPEDSKVGELQAIFGGEYSLPSVGGGTVYNMVPPRGVAVQLGSNFIVPNVFVNNTVLAGGDYPVQAVSPNITQIAPIVLTKFRVFGVVGKGEQRKPFLIMPTRCTGPLKSTVLADDYEDPGHFVERTALSGDSTGQPVGLTGCSKLKFPVSVAVAPDTANASTASGLTVNVHVPQKSAFNPEGLAESALRDTIVTLPEGVTINPAGSNGLEACSEGLAGFAGFKELDPEFEAGVQTATFTPDAPGGLVPGTSFCPNGSKIGSVQIKTPLLSDPIEGAVYLASQNQNPFGSLLAMYLVVEDPISGTVIKLTGEVSLTDTGQIVSTFKNTPDLPFEDLTIHFFGGERAPLSTPARCGTYTTQAVFTPWDGNPPVQTSTSFEITHGPGGGPCPGQSLPFSPSLTAGATNVQAGAFSPFTMTMSRPDGSQNLDAIKLHMPDGLSGTLAGVELCGEAQANEGTCGSGSLIGETTVSVGVGSAPFTVTGGKVYMTGPYRGAPFGLSIVNPAKAGPFDLEATSAKHPACDCLVVRAKIEVDPTSAALTVASDTAGAYRIPTMLEGIPLQIQHINVTINRPGFTFNPTNCSPMAITSELTSSEGATDALSLPFQVTNCARLSFKPGFAVSTSGRTSRAKGASLRVKLTYPNAPRGSQANIAMVRVELPRQLPSRLTTLNHACLDSVFDENPANCSSQSRVGVAKATTPILPVPLEGPAYFVSHGGQKFPELVVVLQGYGVTVYLDGETFISKTGVTSSTFRQVPDVPVGSFELNLPQGPSSALAANTNLCNITKVKLVKKRAIRKVHGHKRRVTVKVRKRIPGSLTMPTTFTAQNGMVIRQSTPVKVTGCVRHKTSKKTRKHR